MKVLVDADVLICLIMREKTRFPACGRLLVMQSFGDIELWTAPFAMLNAYKSLVAASTASIAKKLLCSCLPAFRICSMEEQDLFKAMADARSSNLSSSTLAIAAKKIGAKYLITYSPDTYGKEPVVAISPEGLAEHFSQAGITYDEIQLPDADPSTPALQSLIIGDLKRITHEFAPRFGYLSVALFGSTARGEQTAHSDIDLCVEYEKTPSLLKHSELKRELENAIGRNVDLIAGAHTLYPPVREEYERDRVTLYAS